MISESLLGFIERIPTPIATSLKLVFDSGSDAIARYGALLDTFEGTLVTLTHLQLTEYFRCGFKSAIVDRLIVDLLVEKPALSTGDWLRLLCALTKPFAGRCDQLLCPEIVVSLFTRAGKPTNGLKSAESLCHSRNKHWSHRLGRTPEHFQQRLTVDTPYLLSFLESLSFISEATLLVPTRLDHCTISEALLFVGPDVQSGKYRCHVREEDLAERGGLLRVERSLILHRGEQSRVLYPFFRYRDSTDLALRDLYILTGLAWRTVGGQLRLRKTHFHGRQGSVSDDDSDARGAVERLLLPLIEEVGANQEHILAEDPDHSVPSVWAMQEEAHALFIGRKLLLDEVESRLTSGNGGIVLIIAGPGAGKSAFMFALYERLAGCGVLLHTISAQRSPRVFLRALMNQCSTLLNRPLGAIAYSGIDLDELKAPLERALVEVAAKHGGRCIVIIDALDELILDGISKLEALRWLPTAFPPGIHFVLSTRPLIELLEPLRRRFGDRLVEIPMPPLAREDFDLLVEKHAGREARDRLDEWIAPEEAYLRTEGHPLFMRLLALEGRNELATSRATNRAVQRLNLQEIPSNIRQHMERVWDSAVRSGDPDRRTRELRTRVLEWLCVCYAPGLTLPLLRAVLEDQLCRQVDRDDLIDALSSLSPYLTQSIPGRFMPFHTSLGEFGRARLEDSINPWHLRLARLLALRGPSLDGYYWLEHVTSHAEAGKLDQDEMGVLLGDVNLIQARLNKHGALHGRCVSRFINKITQPDEEKFLAGLISRWSEDASVFGALSKPQCAGLAKLLRSIERYSCWAAAYDVYVRITAESNEPELLIAQANVAYQQLDQWNTAKDALETAACLYGGQNDNIGRALALRSLATVLFDMGLDNPSPEELLRHECLPVLELSGLDVDLALTLECLAVVIDAEARFEEALEVYARAEGIHASHGDWQAVARVSLNRAIALLFEQGFESANNALQRAGRLDNGEDAQFSAYHLANQSLMALLRNNLCDFDRIAALINTDEIWVKLTLEGHRCVRRGLAGDMGVLGDMRSLASQFDAIGDAWGSIDNKVNASWILLRSGNIIDALSEFNHAFASAVTQNYPIGAALAAAGLRELGAIDEQHSVALTFFDSRLSRLYHACSVPFVPCYVLLL